MIFACNFSLIRYRAGIIKTKMKYLRLLLAFAFIPVLISLISELFSFSIDFLGRVSLSTFPFCAGIIGYFLFQAVFDKPLRTYVFGHELTHAIFGILSGAKIKSFRVSEGSGSVSLSKTGLLIALSPYFIPIYTLSLTGVYWGFSRFLDVRPFSSYFLFFVGFTIAFHLSLTSFAIGKGQSDLKQFGVFFSLIFVLIVNCCILAGILKVVLPESISLHKYFYQSFLGTINIFNSLYLFGTKIWISFQRTR